MTNVHGLRRITDDRGVAWEVWEAHPRLIDRRRGAARRAAPRDLARDRRIAASDERPHVVASGWLVFRSALEERRRAPIAEDWHVMTEERLLLVLRQSRATGPHPRVRLAGPCAPGPTAASA